MGLKTKACVWNGGRMISSDLIFAFACKTLDACSSQFDSALVLSSSISRAHLKRTEIYIYIYYSKTFS